MSIVKYILKKAILLLPVLIGISIVAFTLSYLSPGDQVDEYLNPDGNTPYTQEEYYEAQKKLGLDKPAPVQYLIWLKGILSGDFGRSFFTNKSIIGQLKMRIPISLKLAIFSMIITVIFGLLFGVLMALFKDSFIDRALSAMSTFFLSVPGFWMAIILIFIFAETLRILPTSGVTSFKGYILPAVTLSLSGIGGCARLTRTSILEELSKQYVLVADSKGMKKKRTIVIHALANAMIPVVTYLGTRLASIIGGASVIESIFSIPGIGSYAITAVKSKDFYVVQAYVLFSGSVYVVANIIIDIIYLLINPKIRVGEAQE